MFHLLILFYHPAAWLDCGKLCQHTTNPSSLSRARRPNLGGLQDVLGASVT